MSGTTPTDLTDRQPRVRPATTDDLEGLADELAADHAEFAPLYRRREQRAWGEAYVRGLLLTDVPRKNVEALALRLLGAAGAVDRRVRGLQDFIGAGGWDDAALLARHRRLVDETPGEAEGVLLVDGSDVPKQGTRSAGVARQWCGHTGKRDKCQAGVYLGYASTRGYTLLDRRLYLPACWFDEAYADRWWACGIPRATPFRTKHALAGDLVEQATAAGTLRARWVVCDEGDGDSPALLDRWAATGLRYLAEIPRTTQGWPLAEPDGRTPRAAPQTWTPPRRGKRGPVPARVRLHPVGPAKDRADRWAAQVAAARWRRYRVQEGGKGPLVADFVAVRWVTVRARLPGPEGWLVARRSVPTDPAEEPTYKQYTSNAPAATPLAALVRVSGMRWPIEACFAECRQELGLDHDETRSWRGWHHHLTLVILAQHFLVRLQQRLDPREGGLRAGPAAAERDRRPAGPAVTERTAHVQPRPDPPAAACLPAPTVPRSTGCAGPAAVSATPQMRRLPRPPRPATPLARRPVARPFPRCNTSALFLTCGADTDRRYRARFQHIVQYVCALVSVLYFRNGALVQGRGNS